MSPHEMAVQEKQEVERTEEPTRSGRHFTPYTDIYEVDDAIVVTMDIPGVDKSNVEIMLEKNVLTVTGDVNLSMYEGLDPVYTEYNVGNYARSFSISSEIDRDAIAAKVVDGVLELRLPKVKRAAARRISVN